MKKRVSYIMAFGFVSFLFYGTGVTARPIMAALYSAFIIIHIKPHTIYES